MIWWLWRPPNSWGLGHPCWNYAGEHGHEHLHEPAGAVSGLPPTLSVSSACLERLSLCRSSKSRFWKTCSLELQNSYRSIRKTSSQKLRSWFLLPVFCRQLFERQKPLRLQARTHLSARKWRVKQGGSGPFWVLKLGTWEQNRSTKIRDLESHMNPMVWIFNAEKHPAMPHTYPYLGPYSTSHLHVHVHESLVAGYNL